MATKGKMNLSTRALVAADIEPVTTVLVRAFADDPVLRYVIPEVDEWQRIAAPWFKMILTTTLTKGIGLVDEAQRGVSVWEVPDPPEPLFSRLMSLMLTMGLLRHNVVRANRVAAGMRSYRPQRPHHYLAYVGTDPLHQNTGIGASLLAPMIELSRRDGLPIFLECSNRKNLSFYGRHGFSMVAEVDIPGGARVWPMLREAR